MDSLLTSNRFNGKCGICGKEFTGRKSKKWCSDECKMAAWKQTKRAEIIVRHFGYMNEELKAKGFMPYGIGEK